LKYEPGSADVPAVRLWTFEDWLLDNVAARTVEARKAMLKIAVICMVSITDFLLRFKGSFVGTELVVK
jgi:hypothetical protein